METALSAGLGTSQTGPRWIASSRFCNFFFFFFLSYFILVCQPMQANTSLWRAAQLAFATYLYRSRNPRGYQGPSMPSGRCPPAIEAGGMLRKRVGNVALQQPAYGSKAAEANPNLNSPLNSRRVSTDTRIPAREPSHTTRARNE